MKRLIVSAVVITMVGWTALELMQSPVGKIETAERRTGYNSISVDTLYEKHKTEELAILDVREVEEFHQEHIPFAENIPLSQLEERLIELDKETSYYIICNSGNRSARASKTLSNQGFFVTNVRGGMSSWKGDKI